MFTTCKSLQRHFSTTVLKKETNQAYGLAKYAIDFIKSSRPPYQVYDQVKLFHTDSVLCGYLSLSLKANNPSIFKNEALSTARRESKVSRPRMGQARVFGSKDNCPIEKAIVANISAVNEFSANGVFLSSQKKGDRIHREVIAQSFFPITIAAGQQTPAMTGEKVAKGMILLSEIQGRLFEAFPLASYKFDSNIYGALASTITYGALMAATPKQIEDAISILLTHNIPTLANQQGEELAEIQTASSAILAESALSAIRRAQFGMSGPSDIFRHPQGIFRILEETDGDSPFDLPLTESGNDFALMKSHFRLGLYNMHAASAIEAVFQLLKENKFLVPGYPEGIQKIKISTYHSALETVGDKNRKNISTRQSAVNSVYYIVATILRKALEIKDFNDNNFSSVDDLWKLLILTPADFSHSALENTITQSLMKKITCEYIGKEFDEQYPEGLPTAVDITLTNGTELQSQVVAYPAGHSQNTEANLQELLNHKFEVFVQTGVPLKDDLLEKLQNLDELTNFELLQVYSYPIKYADKTIDD